MFRCLPGVLCLALLLVSALPNPSRAGTKVYEGEDGSFVEVGGRVQLQYRNFRPSRDGAESVDNMFFRRLRPYLKGSVTKDWEGMIQIDFGKSLDSDELAVKDAFLRYKGFSNPSFALTFGNIKGYYSREFLTSSKKNQLVERTFVGDHNFGGFDRVLGVHFLGSTGSGKVQVGLSAGSESHDPGVFTMDFDTPVNDAGDWNQGWGASGRVDVFPMGKTSYDQGDFHSDTSHILLGVGAFGWSNDGDNNLHTNKDGGSLSQKKADLKSAYGGTADAGFRGHGISADAQVNFTHGETEVETLTAGLYRDGATDLVSAAVEGGYMIVRKRLELVVAYDMLDASNFMQTWSRVHAGANLFIDRNYLKFQIEYFRSMNIEGVDGADADNILVQGQFYF